MLESVALECRSVDESSLAKALELSLNEPRFTISSLLEAHVVDENRFLQVLAQRLGMSVWESVLPAMPDDLRKLVPPRLALPNRFFPVRISDGSLALLTTDPFDLIARQAVASEIQESVTWCLAPRKAILTALRIGYGVGAETFDAILDGRTIEDEVDLRQEVNVLDDQDPEASVVSFVNQIMREALRERATDIHVEPLENDLQIRYRIDGILNQVPVPQKIKLLQASVISRLKIMAHLDIAEKRLPQDGRINLELEGQPIDVRVATIPTVSGESVSLRLLARNRFDFDLLGLTGQTKKSVQDLIALPNGIILLTGPTGCGKSTSLYTFLSALNTAERRIVTVEDPVEHKLSGVMQIAVKPEINLNFATALRSILRGDPNVIMVGEMRDAETVEIAIRAALTGHLVFSTLHTNDAIGGIIRLIDMGIQPYLVSSSVRAFIAQRLVRVLCPQCRQTSHHSEPFLLQIGFPMEMQDRIFGPSGCERCRHTGYQGRAALFEICLVTPTLAEMISQRKSSEALLARALQDGMIPLRQDGWRRVIDGTTSVEEVVRVTASDMSVIDE